MDIDLKVLKPTTMDAFPASNASMRSLPQTEMSDFQPPKNIYDDEYIVLDQKKVPQNVIEGIENKMIRMNRRIKRKFGTKEKWDEAFSKDQKADKNGNVSVD